MKRFAFCSLVFFSRLPLLFAIAPHAQASDSLLDRLHHAAEATTLDAPASAPFHLKLSIDILPQYGRDADKGTVEIWWTAKDQQRIAYDFSQYHATIVHTPNGILRTAGAEGSPYIVDYLIGQVLHPVSVKLNEQDFRIEAAAQPLGKMKLDCIDVTPSSRRANTDRTSYCFDSRKDLRVVLTNPDQYNLRQKLGVLGTQSVPLTLQYTFLRSLVATAHIDALQSQKSAYPEASDTTGLVPVPSPAVSVPNQTSSGHLLHKADPIYPQEAKEKHISGTVLLHGIIGADGKVKSLSLIGSPHDSLTKSAMEAVRKWVYEPYRLNNVPTEVDTTIAVHYEFAERN